MSGYCDGFFAAACGANLYWWCVEFRLYNFLFEQPMTVNNKLIFLIRFTFIDINSIIDIIIDLKRKSTYFILNSIQNYCVCSIIKTISAC